MSGNVQIHDGESWVALDAGRELNAGDSIWTGRNGRILLMNDQGSVLLAPKSLVKIPAQALPNSFSVLFQTHGTVSAEVDKRRKRYFSIQTPYLAAVVKGTEFDVEIEKKQTRVSVSKGLVSTGQKQFSTGQKQWLGRQPKQGRAINRHIASGRHARNTGATPASIGATAGR